MIRRERTALAAIVLAVAVTACGATQESVDGSAATSTTTLAATTTTQSATSTAAATTTAAPTTTTTVPEIEVTATDYTFEGLPEIVPIGTKVSLVNESGVEFHEMVIYQLLDSETRSVEELSRLPFEELHYASTELGSIHSVVLAMPDSPQYSVLIGSPVFWVPGRYLVFCSILVGADPDSARAQAERGPMYSVEGIARHYELGMITEVVVEG